MRPRSITVFGSSQPTPGSARYAQARELGRQLAASGYVVVNGGYSGTMEGVSRGAVEAGGRAIGITCALFDGDRGPGGNRYLTRAHHAPDLLARLRDLTEMGDGYVVLDGGVGTLLELFLVWNLLTIGVTNKPCVLLGAHWRQVLADLERETQVGPEHVSALQIADTVESAVGMLVDALA
jgi:uncharacterized protein (TIGR00730 family)